MKFVALFTMSLLVLSSSALSQVRSVYLNGVDVSSARNQSLKKVNLRIDENGSIYIEAPQYKVSEENSFTPMSEWIKESTAEKPKHKPPQALPAGAIPLHDNKTESKEDVPPQPR